MYVKGKKCQVKFTVLMVMVNYLFIINIFVQGESQEADVFKTFLVLFE